MWNTKGISLLYTTPEANLADYNIGQHEALLTEPLHHITGHTKNLFQELPYHLQKTDKKLLEDAIESSFCEKDNRRASDYRLSLLKITSFTSESSIIPVYNI